MGFLDMIVQEVVKSTVKEFGNFVDKKIDKVACYVKCPYCRTRLGLQDKNGVIICCECDRNFIVNIEKKLSSCPNCNTINEKEESDGVSFNCCECNKKYNSWFNGITSEYFRDMKVVLKESS